MKDDFTFTALSIFLAWYSQHMSALMWVRLVLTIYPPFRLRWYKGEAQGAYFWLGFRAAFHHALMCIPRRPLGNKFSFLQYVLLVQYTLSSQNISNICHFTSAVTLCREGLFTHCQLYCNDLSWFFLLE